ncbi:MAG: glycosyltransferase family 2 protein [Sedimentisphaerales bacterium]|nr:glycosyltransferase family 2 protein [Sedimentisphaerales bacterium]
MKLAIIIVSWNVKDELRNCLNSIAQYPPEDEFEIIVVDNGSTDGTADMLTKEYSSVKLTANEKNAGFAGGNNQGIETAKGEYIFLLNPDTIIKSGALDYLINYMDKNKDVGACGPRLRFADGKIQHSVRRFPTMRGALYRHTLFKSLGIFKSKYNHWLMKDFAYDKTTDVDQIMGAALMIRKSVLDKVGYMDDKCFFMYYEEVDLCYRIKKAGWRIVFLPDVEVTHLGGRSSGQIPAEKTAMAMKSLLRYFKKHRSRTSYLLFICIFIPAFLIGKIGTILLFSAVYVISLISFNSKQRKKSAIKLKLSAKLLGYSFQQAVKQSFVHFGG